LREGRFRNCFLADLQEVGAIVGAVLADDVGVDGDAHGIGEGVEDALYGDIFDRRVDERSHALMMIVPNKRLFNSS
jgi:hypothetical protein